jgi:hypothetical protein
VLLFVCMAACGQNSHTPRTTPTAVMTIAPPRQPAPPAPPILRVLVCGFGGVGPQGLPDQPDAWVVAVVGLASLGTALSGARVNSITMLDANGAVLAHAKAPIDTRTVPAGRATNDFSAQGTMPFSGEVAKGATVLLRVSAPLDARRAALYRTPPTRVRIDVVDAKGHAMTVEGAGLTSWPTG